MPPSTDTPRGDGRCFVCLCDQDPTSGEAWVRPCPCSLEGHQDCLMAWITELENDRKPIKCPVCKADIKVDEPFDLAVTVGNSLHRVFSRASPWILAGGVFSGTSVALTCYGQFAMGVFAGWDEFRRYLLNASTSAVRIRRLATLQLVAPALLIAQTLPPMGNYIFLPVAGLYGMFHIGRDDDFFSWPPSPQLVLATLPVVRSVYRHLWWEFVRPYERKLDRRIAGLPEPEPNAERRDRRWAEDGNRHNHDQDHDHGHDHDHRHEHGGIVGMLDAAINLLDIPEVDVGLQVQEHVMVGGNADAEGPDAEMQHVELEVEAVGGEEGFDERDVGEGAHHDDEDDMLAQGEAHADQIPQEGRIEVQGEHDAAQPPIGNDEQHQQDQQQPQDNDVADPAAAAAANRQWNLQASLRDITNAIAAAFLLPAISAGTGEALHLLLPRTMTSPAPWYVARPGLLRQTWGRSLVGGCLYFVIRDVFRFYTKYRRSVNKPQRRVRNIDSEERVEGGTGVS